MNCREKLLKTSFGVVDKAAREASLEGEGTVVLAFFDHEVGKYCYKWDWCKRLPDSNLDAQIQFFYVKGKQFDTMG